MCVKKIIDNILLRKLSQQVTLWKILKKNKAIIY